MIHVTRSYRPESGSMAIISGAQSDLGRSRYSDHGDFLEQLDDGHVTVSHFAVGEPDRNGW